MRVLWPHNFDKSKQNAGIFMVNAANELNKSDIEVQLSFLGNLRNPLNIFDAQRKIKKMARNFDLVHAQYGSACSLTTLKIESCPKVLTLRGSDWNNPPTTGFFQRMHKKMSINFTKYAIESYDLILTVSERMKNEVSDIFPNLNIATLASPIDLKRFVPMDKIIARRKLGFIDNTEKWVLFTSVDENNPIKRINIARQAFYLAQKKMENLRLVVASGIPHSEMPLYVAACDIIICTSVSEGWPNSIKEALACNVPFVSTDVSDLRLIASVENNCRICEPIPEAFAQSIIEVLNMEYNSNLRNHVIDMDMQSFSRTLISLYNSII